MPGGRVQPVVLQKKSLPVTQPPSKHIAQLEDARQKAVNAQRVLLEQQQAEQKRANDEMLRRQHEAKLNETAGDELGRQQEADEELRQFQRTGLAQEVKMSRESLLLLENARHASLDEKPVSTTDPVTDAPDDPLPIQAVPAPEVNMESELAAIRARIAGVLNEDVYSLNA